MRILTYVIILSIGIFLGYQVSKKIDKNKLLAANLAPVVSEIYAQIAAIDEKLKTNLSVTEIASLTEQKNKLTDLVNKFLGK